MATMPIGGGAVPNNLLPPYLQGGYAGGKGNGQSGSATQQTSSNSSGVQGGFIPNAGLYAEEQAAAEAAYQQSLAAAQRRRDTLYSTYGLTSSGAVDPKAQYGNYQLMLGGEGQQLDDALASSVGRGLGAGTGLANQAESRLRVGQNAQNLNFQRSVSDVAYQYSQAMLAAEQARKQAQIQAMRDAINYGTQNQDYTPADPNAGTQPTYSPGAFQGSLPNLQAHLADPMIAKALGKQLSKIGKKYKIPNFIGRL
jgi:hypothetical protein